MEQQHRITIVGDLFPVPSNYKQFAEGDVAYLFGDKILELFSSADYKICNMEGALTDRPGKCEKTGPVLSAPVSAIKAYKELGIDCCTLANNHITDAGAVGVIDTIKTIEEADIEQLGAGENISCIKHYILFKVGRKTICLYNVGETMYNEPTDTMPGAYLYDEYVVCKELEKLKTECDFIIVVYHGGAEKFRYPSPQTRKRFHRMADCGANIILSQHTHCVGCEEWYKGAYLLYGQGNFLFRSFNNEFTDTGLIVELILEDSGFLVKKHLVRAIGDTVRYDKQQDFSAFNERSSKVLDGNFVQREFERYCLKESYVYLRAYKGKTPLRKLFCRFLPKQYESFVLTSYRRNQLLFTLHSLRSEQNREIAIEGIKQLLKANKYE